MLSTINIILEFIRLEDKKHFIQIIIHIAKQEGMQGWQITNILHESKYVFDRAYDVLSVANRAEIRQRLSNMKFYALHRIHADDRWAHISEERIRNCYQRNRLISECSPERSDAVALIKDYREWSDAGANSYNAGRYVRAVAEVNEMVKRYSNEPSVRFIFDGDLGVIGVYLK